jgi:integrase
MKAGSKPASEVSAADLRALLRVSAAGSTLARQRFGAVSHFLGWCLDEGHVTASVCASIGKSTGPSRLPPAAATLTPAQVAALWTAAGGMAEGVRRDFARFLLVIPCRRNEAARMDWTHVSLSGAAWTQPDS